MNKEILEKIIKAGNQAPSGGNSQPWKFVVENNTINVVTLPEKDHRLLNFNHRGTNVAHGALIENINIASRFFGYEPKFSIFPKDNISVSITFSELKTKENESLYNFIFKRHSNRKPFSTDPLFKEEKSYLFKDIAKFSQCNLLLVEGKSIHDVAQNASCDITVNLQNKLLHDLFFKEVIWNEEDQKKRTGLYIKTLEILPPKSTILNLLKHWKISIFFSKIGLTKKIQAENAKTMSSSALFGAILVKNNDRDFIQAGRLMEDIWLKATKMGLGLHLATGLVFFWQQANFGENQIFSAKDRYIIDEAYKNLLNIFGIKDKIIALTFRVGKAEAPSAVSYNRPPDIEWK